MKMTKKQYRELVRKAEEFKEILSGDGGYTDPNANAIALNNMLIGWITAQPYCAQYVRDCKRNGASPDLFIVADDKSTQAMHDVLKPKDIRFRVSEISKTLDEILYEVEPQILAGIYSETKEQAIFRLCKIASILNPRLFKRLKRNDPSLAKV